MKRAVAIVIAVMLSGAMVVLALPPSGIWPLAWFALTPIFIATRGTRFVIGFVAAVASAMFAAFVSTNGYLYRTGTSGGEPTWTYVGFALFGMIFGIVAAVASEVKQPDFRLFAGIGAVAVLLEWASLQLVPALLELSQASVFPLLLLASVTGIWGLGFLLWLYNFALAEMCARKSKWALGLLAFPVFLATGSSASPLFKNGSVVEKVGLIQSEAYEVSTFRKLSQEAASQGANLVVWPEFSGLLFVRNGNTVRLRSLAKEVKMPAFVTSFQDGNKPLPHNTAVLFSERGESSAYYKRKLFGAESNMHMPGAKAVAVPWLNGKLGLNICFDSCYPAVIRDTALLGADIIALPTIDPSSPYSFFAANHAAFTPIRAAENGVSMIRCDGAAYSVIVDPYGRVVAHIPEGKDRFTVAEVPQTGHWTFYRWAGDWFLYLCGGILVWTLATSRRPASLTKESASTQPDLPS